MMKHKIAKRSASDYEDSISSQSSCQDSIITLIELSEGHSQCSSVFINECVTPTKNAKGQNEHTYSLRKVEPFESNMPIGSDEDSLERRLWVHES